MEGEFAVPPKTLAQPMAPLRVKPALRRVLRRIAWQLQARYETPITETFILEQFLEEEVTSWALRRYGLSVTTEK